jgi:flavin-dependent dehydrogenase
MLRGHGMHYAWIMTSGRIAGESAARRLPRGFA